MSNIKPRNRERRQARILVKKWLCVEETGLISEENCEMTSDTRKERKGVTDEEKNANKPKKKKALTRCEKIKNLLDKYEFHEK